MVTGFDQAFYDMKVMYTAGDKNYQCEYIGPSFIAALADRSTSLSLDTTVTVVHTSTLGWGW